MRKLLEEHYMLTSIALLVFLFLVVFVCMERKRLRAREITLLATMTALCVGLNEICTHTIPLHAGTAMVILCGIALGEEAGVMIGFMARFLCNFFDGQGPWTPWEMFAWGMLGFLAGICFNRVILKKHIPGERQTLAQRLSLKKEYGFRILVMPVFCVLAAWVLAYLTYLFGMGVGAEEKSFFGWRLYAFGGAGLLAGSLLQRKRLSADPYTTAVFTFLVVFLFYGGVMNFAAMLLMAAADSTQGISLSTLRALYISGVPYDIEHAGTAALCVFVMGDGVLQKLQRIQIKYGIMVGGKKNTAKAKDERRKET
jgi:energy-coupling factor transport system substrate-specific component